MQHIKSLAQRYIDWLIRLGRVKFSLLGIFLLAVFALSLQVLLSFFIIGDIYWLDIVRSIIFGLMSAPFVIYFFAVLVERLETSRQQLSRSVTELKKEVSERKQTENKLSIALDNLEEIHRDKSNLMATISHELRTPLNGIIGLSRILLDGNLTEEQRSYLKTISVSAVSLGHIFNEIIDMEKIDANRIRINLQPTALSSLLNDIQNFGVLLSEQKKLQFITDYDSNLPNWLMLDSVRLSQILWNLINNAVKFTQDGFIRLTVKGTSPQTYEFTITDTGIGIPNEELPYIFEMYYQVKKQPDNQINLVGSGIGLSVSKTLANLMGGDLTVKSQVGKGSTFILSITAMEALAPQQLDCYQGRHLNILLVEDLELNILVARSVLEKLGHQVDSALNGKQAIRLFEQNNYDLVLLDIQLPDMTGFQIAQYLRKRYEEGIYDSLPPLIAFTANVMHDEEEYLDQGMDGVLRKPLAIDELNTCLCVHLDEYFHEKPLSLNDQIEQSETLDLALLQLLNKSQIEQSLKMFEKMIPNYLIELKAYYQQYQSTGKLQQITHQAHKIKGAAASVGLRSIYQLANELEHLNVEYYDEKCKELINELENQYQKNMDELKAYLYQVVE
ncbi:ATP-binding protein [Rodentibacter caecimuris]|uniref:Aerobic respiration control sensor protein n=1 Tax=Rodentibacter caecimuris TaxID=1796644 RepID=A0ABX3KZM4_9PAST|nr:hybrid sensor histidine kinase/response regulator [Rodentibacter heylii]